MNIQILVKELKKDLIYSKDYGIVMVANVSIPGVGQCPTLFLEKKEIVRNW